MIKTELFVLQLRCLRVRINTVGNDRIVAWVSRNGEVEDYWGGATSQQEGFCACGEAGKYAKIKFFAWRASSVHKASR